MISLSSIVKANLLVEVPGKPCDMNDSTNNNCDKKETQQQTSSSAGEDEIIKIALGKAKQIEMEAQAKAESLMNKAVIGSRELMGEAEKRGYEEGYLRGLVDGASASESAAEEGLLELKKLIDLMQLEHHKMIQEQEEHLLKIAFELSNKIMKNHVKEDEEAVLKMLEELILENEGCIKIHVSEYQKFLEVRLDKSFIKKIRNFSKDTKVVMVKEEDQILCETESGLVDMSLPMQMEQLKKAVIPVS